MKSVKNLQSVFLMTTAIILGMSQSSPANEVKANDNKIKPITTFDLFKSLINVPTNTLADSKTFQVSHFTGLAIAVNMDVIVDLDNKEGLRIEGDDEAIADLIVEVKGNSLVIRTRETWKLWNKKHFNKKLKAYVSAKSLSAISMASSGSVKVNNAIKSDKLSINISGSGNVEANTQVQSLNCNISGSGVAVLSGQAKEATVIISGSGRLKEGLKINELTTVISGSGHVKANVENKLDAVISGSGSVHYSGNPTVNKRTSGSGRVNKI